MTYRHLLAAVVLLAAFQLSFAQPLIREEFGVTSTMTIPLEKYDDMKVVRTYTSAGSFCKESEQYMFEPTWQNFHYDRTLEEAKSKGIKFVMCVTNNMPYYTTNGTTENEDNPVPPGADKDDPNSYIMYAKLFYQIAARYGSKTVSDSLLKVKDYPTTDYRHQTKRSGTNLLYGLELWNEANKWGGNFTPHQYFCMLSAVYDGNKHTMGPDAGVMLADSDFNLIFTGTSADTPAYHMAVRDYWVQERHEPFPENIIWNFHGYFHNKFINNGNRTMGITPELGKAMKLYRDWQTFAGNNRVAKTEYGYDTNPVSVQHAPTLLRPDSTAYDINEAQGALILRDYHLQTLFPCFFLSTFYNVRDGTNGGSTIQYSTSGITKGTCCNYDPKPAYFIITGFTELAGDYSSHGTLLREDPYVVEYENPNGGYLYAVWEYSKNKFMIDNVVSTDDTVKVIQPSVNGNVYSNIIPANGVFSVEAQQMPTYLKTKNRSFFNLTLSGTIKTPGGVPVSGVKVYLTGSASDSMVTAKNGVYSFPVDSNGTYKVTPIKTTDSPATNGVTSLDIALIRRHLLNVGLFSSAYQIIAADVNTSTTVTTTDVTLIRSLILGKPSYPNGKLWQFVNSEEIFPVLLHPFPFENARNFINVTQTQVNKNFIAIKLGDVNSSWTQP